MENTQFPEIHSDRCIGCGSCTIVCPYQTLSVINKKIEITNDRCLECGHCVAACPQQALKLACLDGDMQFYTFQTPSDWMSHGRYDLAGLVHLMRSRRSCRNFTNQPVDKEILEDLVKIGTTAPSGTNSQCWTFSIVSNRETMLEWALVIRNFFYRLNALAGHWWLRTLLKLIGKKELSVYYKNNYESVKQAVDRWDTQEEDLLFHGAAALIVIGSNPGGSCPTEDALLASQNILLAAHAMGLGTCLIGYAVESANRDAKIKQFLKMNTDETVHAVIALGYPDEKYAGLPGRKPVIPRYV